MANLLITSSCNRKCDFCFAKSKLNRSSDRTRPVTMSRDDVRRVMDLLCRSGEMDLRLLGGEPTIHPEFIELATEAHQRGFHLRVFTNGMMSAEVADFLAELPTGAASLLVNISPQAKDTARMVARRDYALSRLGDRAALGITLTDTEWEYEFLLETINRFNLTRRIRLGVAQPIVGKNNDYLDPARYGDLGRSIVAMARRCVEEDVLIGFDCGMTMCMFDEADHAVLATCTEGFRSLCKPIVDIGPDLSVWHCFPLADVLNTHLDHFENRNSIARYYQKVVKSYRSLGCKPECMQCVYLRRGQCCGGCLAHTMNAMNRKPPAEAPQP